MEGGEDEDGRYQVEDRTGQDEDGGAEDEAGRGGEIEKEKMCKRRRD